MRINVEKIPAKTNTGKAKQVHTVLVAMKTLSGWKFLNPFVRRTMNRVVYLGHCNQDGDLFAVYWRGYISFVKGKLNDGTILTEQQ